MQHSISPQTNPTSIFSRTTSFPRTIFGTTNDGQNTHWRVVFHKKLHYTSFGKYSSPAARSVTAIPTQTRENQIWRIWTQGHTESSSRSIPASVGSNDSRFLTRDASTGINEATAAYYLNSDLNVTPTLNQPQDDRTKIQVTNSNAQTITISQTTIVANFKTFTPWQTSHVRPMSLKQLTSFFITQLKWPTSSTNCFNLIKPNRRFYPTPETCEDPAVSTISKDASTTKS